MHAKIHRCTCTRADLDYMGSVSIDSEIMNAVGILPHEKVLLVNMRDGARLETYAIEAPAGSKTIGMNGGCAHLIRKGDICLIIAFTDLSEGESMKSRVAIMGPGNEIEALMEEDVVFPASQNGEVSKETGVSKAARN